MVLGPSCSTPKTMTGSLVSFPINSIASLLFDSQNQIITINVASQTPLKLTSNNYTTWRAQFNSLVVGLNLKVYINGSTPCPSKTIIENNTEIPNPTYLFWIRQDQLIFNAILGFVSEDISPLITLSESSQATWEKLATTYAKPSHTRIHHLNENNTHLSHDTLTIPRYMQQSKDYDDALALVDAPIGETFLIIHILDGLNSEFKKIVVSLRACETSITFKELHDKLLAHVGYLKREGLKQNKTTSLHI